ncbi:TAP42 family protein [Schizosaccharomyces cryophilus OY26]|uniref:TAP42 family protein n=1 Tax=Schizosaccharomyces cryophilus (strain OY26 / ATCC MYA-4695 / CBS 11777 / NBRC 106824 / NRRL Y48691) TaxID=653667 RepID=S9VUP5_SCHCR|nr:TAP42 family protein [Schizosaccharomyces cryophilus OY26]EPY49810.1 TAP42 family protein [Schizosaccharomyces cryophilus OY26]
MNSKSLKDLLNETNQLKETKGITQETIPQLVHGYESCLGLVHKARLFSMNEDIDEVKTSELRYLLLDFELAKCMEQWMQNDRLKVIEYSKNHYESFLRICEGYGLKPLPVSSFTKDSDARSIKIARYKLRKDMEKEMSSITGESTQDEELERKKWTNKIQMALEDTVDDLGHVEMEIQILRNSEKVLQRNEDDEEKKDDETLKKEEQRKRDQNTWKLDMLTKDGLLDPKNRPIQPFTIVSDRNTKSKNVFGPGYNLPTMSVDDYLDEEYKRGNIVSQKDNPNQEEFEDEEDDEISDAKTMKERYWDEYKEANPRGSGNTMVNRG